MLSCAEQSTVKASNLKVERIWKDKKVYICSSTHSLNYDPAMSYASSLCGKYLTAVTSTANQYTLTLSSSSTSSYQRWRIKTVNVADKSYNIINGGYTTRYLSTNTSSPIYFCNNLDGYQAKVLTSAFTCVLAKTATTNLSVCIRNSTADWALLTDYFADTTPQFYDNLFEGVETGEWLLEPVYIKGDVNMDGKITQDDASLALRAATEIETISSLQTFLADMDNNGVLKIADANKILQML